MAATGSVPAGTRVGRYEIVSLLRQGGMGEVYTAHDRNLGRRVALKILPRNRTSDPERVARFVREAQASSTLNHPSIVAVHDAGSEGDVHFLAMELIDGESLTDWMRKRRSLANRVEVMAQVAEGLAKAHDAGIVHRDLKPDNIMVTRDGRAKIVDFGVAKLTERLGERTALSGVTTPTSRVGTTAYMAPEQVEGKTIDRRTDVFAFGSVLYELLTGANPFAAPQYADTIHNVVHLDPTMDRVPRELRRIVRRCLRKDVEQRYDSMRDIALDLREAAVETAPRRPWRRWTALAVAMVLAIAGITWFVASRKTQTVTEQRGMTMTRLTNNGQVTTAAISPDGNYLVHAVEERGDQALYVKQIATGTLTRIAEAAPVYYFNLQVSPDGNYAYYIMAMRAEPNVYDLYQLPLLGGAPRKIAADTEDWYSISPDGTRVVFRRFNAFTREHRLTIAAVDGSGEQVVLRRSHPQYIGTPVWAPDGAITFVSGSVMERHSGGLFRMLPETAEVTQVATPSFPGVGSYAWLPDGSGALATVYDKEQPPQIWFVPTGDTAPRKVTSEVSAYFGVRPTADSKSFSAVRESTESNIYMIGADGQLRAITTGTGNLVGGVVWLNDREVLYSAPVNGMNAYYAVDANNGTPRRIIHNLSTWQAAVSRDGSKIAFVSDHSGANQIWVADASGANLRQVTRVGNNGFPSFTPDGKWIVFMRSDEAQNAWRVPVDGGEPVRVTNLPTNRPYVSPDGKWLLCRMRSTDPKVPLWRTTVMPFDRAGAPRHFDLPHYGGPPTFRWHPDGDAFLFVDFKDGVANLWMQKIDGGAPRQLTFFDSGEIYSFGIAPDGKRIALSRGQSTRDAVLIRDFR